MHLQYFVIFIAIYLLYPSLAQDDSGVGAVGSVFGSAAGALGAGAALVSSLTSVLPEGKVVNGRYYPSQFSLSHQIGLQGINMLVDDVFKHERKRALKAAREASCKRRDQCVWEKSIAHVRSWFSVGSESKKREIDLLQRIDCDVLFAGCTKFY